MARIYAALIAKGIKTMADVPEGLRAAVEELLSAGNQPEDAG